MPNPLPELTLEQHEELGVKLCEADTAIMEARIAYQNSYGKRYQKADEPVELKRVIARLEKDISKLRSMMDSQVAGEFVDRGDPEMTVRVLAAYYPKSRG